MFSNLYSIKRKQAVLKSKSDTRNLKKMIIKIKNNYPNLVK